MKVALNSVDIFPGRERLMPFRIVVEVAKVMVQNGIEAHIINTAVTEESPVNYEYEGIKIIQAPRNFTALSKFINGRSYDVFLFAATFRDGIKDLSALGEIKCKKIMYIGSGINPKCNALYLLKHFGWSVSRTFVLEAFAPKYLLDQKLSQAGFTDVVTLTNLTARYFKHLKSHCIYAGTDGFEQRNSDFSIVKENGLWGKKFFLFSGAPAPTRGAELLLHAIDRLAVDIKNIKIVFLMRTDIGSKYDSFMTQVNNLKNKENIIILRETVTIPQLKGFMEAAYALVLPFICIPSEIPITYYESLSVGTPVVSFHNGGTTEYLQNGLASAGNVSINNLKIALKKLWIDEKERKTLSEEGKILMAKHPDWTTVGKQWIKLLSN